MNCTRNEFINKVHSKWPHKHISDDVLITGISSDIHTVYMLDTLGECQLDIATKFAIASHIWRDDAVLRDIDGLFSQSASTSINPKFVNVPMPHYPFKITYVDIFGNPVDVAGNPINKTSDSIIVKSLKCECGSSSVGSNKHSSYCPVKE